MRPDPALSPQERLTLSDVETDLRETTDELFCSFEPICREPGCPCPGHVRGIVVKEQERLGAHAETVGQAMEGLLIGLDGAEIGRASCRERV